MIKFTIPPARICDLVGDHLMAVTVSRIDHLHPVYRCISRKIPKTDGCFRECGHHSGRSLPSCTNSESARLMCSNRRYIVMAMSLCLVGRRRLLGSRFRFCCYTQSRRNTTGGSNLEQISSCSFLHFSPLRVGQILHADRELGYKIESVLLLK